MIAQADLDALDPQVFARYLNHAGWTEREPGLPASVWELDAEGEQFELLLPLDRSFRDFRARLWDALRTVAIAEQRDPEAVLRDIAATTVDSQHFHLLPDFPTGKIPLVDGSAALYGVRLLMTAAAEWAFRRLNASGGPGQRANGFVRSVQLVAPTPGSFVITTQIPVINEIPRQFLAARTPLEQSSINRNIVLQLHRAVSATHRAAGESLRTGDIAPFVERAGQGVTADLCEAVTAIGRRQPFELRFSWAQSLPVNVQSPRLRFDRQVLRAIRDAAPQLPGHDAEQDVRLVAKVVQLDRVDQGFGRVSLLVESSDGGIPSRARLTANLPPDLYNVAVDGHRTSARLVLTGRLRGDHLSLVESMTLLSG
ncbi:hypothetical protein [Dactylosporangium sp. NPDC048998]|uniref:hypothetical protein n=1 Tax=Dactylosporangium sp. NPDC048998 TaxID=3363976 RepID=UPI0037156665